ncbi:MAG: helix-turn-helix domain-containing protein [Patescibacteria group bacterium]|nr:helix-turn-helix domain-containing protein [Patescibacteria group bacterium]
MENQMEKLKKVFSLNNYEAKLYWAALNFESASLSDLAKGAGIPRTAAYRHVQNLVDKGFLLIFKLKKRKLYQALSPKQLRYLLERKMVTLEEITDDLVERISVPEKKLAISYYSGIEGVQIASDIWLENAKTKFGKSFENVEGTILQHGTKQVAQCINKRVSKGIGGRMIGSGQIDSPILKDVLRKDKAELRESIVVSHKIYPIKASFGVLDDMVIIFTTEENPFAVLIKNQDVADSVNSIHDMVWDRYNP